MNYSPIIEYDYRGQIQLLPFTPEPYLQITNHPTGITLSDPQVNIVDCAGVRHDISGNFSFQPFADKNGNPQILFEIVNIQLDFPDELVYLEILDDETTLYSNKISITEREAILTSYFSYRNNSDFWGVDYENNPGAFQSIRLACYLNDYVSNDEVETYYQISKNQNIITRALISDLNVYHMEYLDTWTAKRLKRTLYSDYCYINGVRSYISDPFEKETRVAASNIAPSSFQVDPDETDLRPVPGIPPVPEDNNFDYFFNFNIPS